MSPKKSSQSELEQLATKVKQRFLAEKRVLSFDEYLERYFSHD